MGVDLRFNLGTCTLSSRRVSRFFFRSLVPGLLLFVLCISLTEACSCSAKTPQELINASDLVFAGTVEDIDTSLNTNEMIVTIATSAVWKGNVTKQMSLRAQKLSICKPHIREGQEYLFYAVKQDGELWAAPCGGTKLYSDADEKIAVLGEPTTIYASRKSKLSWQIILAIVALCGLTFLALNRKYR